ncbi:MAG: protein kinase domain-containing protein [Gemmataceae bacterium]
MTACPTCGKHHEPTVRFCPEDGTPLSETATASGMRTPTSPHATLKMELALPVVVGDRYKLTEVRGGGGMAKVYRAVDQTLEREVAVKIINPELRADPEFDLRFQREARIASQLADPHIVVVHDFGIDPAYGPFLVMEFLQGTTLRERLQSQGSLPVNAAVQLWGQLLLALIHAHAKGIVHRDIKPDNLFLLSQSGVRMHLRILDFGIARMLRRGEPVDSHTLTHPGAVLGTPRYMSPEQLAGQVVDARSDLYSSGLVIHEALTGDLPYASSRKLIDSCPQAPVALQQLIEHCLKPSPDERPQNAIEVYRRLQEAGRESGLTELLPDEVDPTPVIPKGSQSTVSYVVAKTEKGRRHRRIALLAGAGIVVLAGVIGLLHHFLKSDSFATPDRESLLGVKIGFNRDELIAALREAPEKEQPHGNPWTGDYQKLLGHILKPKDVQGDGDDLEDLDLLLWSNGEVCALLHANTVKALVVRKRHFGSTGRGIRVGDTETEIKNRYSLDLDPETKIFHFKSDDRSSHWTHPLPGVFTLGKPGGSSKQTTSGMAYRYNSLGIGFEVVNEKVTAIALYPPASATESTP